MGKGGGGYRARVRGTRIKSRIKETPNHHQKLVLETRAHSYYLRASFRSKISRGAMQRDAAARSGVLMQIHTSCGAGCGHQGVPGV